MPLAPPSLGALVMLRQALAFRTPVLSQRTTVAAAAATAAAPTLLRRISHFKTTATALAQIQLSAFSTSSSQNATYNQVRRGCRVEQRARKKRSPALKDRPQMKGVCLKTGTTKPKKPNSGERKIARIKLSDGRLVTGYIPGEGHNIQQHSVVLVRGGRAQDCPGVRYHVVRGALDL
ncbi:hypothetical protein KEM54_001463, partial [Ascosphaera aggregata]